LAARICPAGHLNAWLPEIAPQSAPSPFAMNGSRTTGS
jgi:hypothetical protein